MTAATFESVFEHRGVVRLPDFSGTRIMMLPLVLGDAATVPDFLNHWRDAIAQLFSWCRPLNGQVGYLTIDEKEVAAGATHRRAGLHVDGVYRNGAGGWGGGWSSVSHGMLTVASHEGCRAWKQTVEGQPRGEGECDHLASRLREDCAEVLRPNHAYWMGGLCVHESLPQVRPVRRQFVRLSMPSKAPWFEGYTVNPLCIQPTGPILPRRAFMDM